MFITDKYTKESGSAIIKLKPGYLQTLNLGEHTLTVVFEEGNEVTVKFYVKQKSSNKESKTYAIPRTGIE